MQKIQGDAIVAIILCVRDMEKLLAPGRPHEKRNVPFELTREQELPRKWPLENLIDFQ